MTTYAPDLINDVAKFVTNIRLKTNEIVINDKQQELNVLKEHLARLNNNQLSTSTNNGDLKMTEQNDKAQASQQPSDKVQNYKIYVYREPELNTIVPKTGKNAGKEIDVVSVKVLHRNYEIDPTSGDFIKKDPTFMTLKKYGDAKDNVKQLASLIQPGMQLRVSGSLTSHEYEFKDQKTGEMRKQTALELNANNLMLDLSQKGLKGINFEQQKQNEQTQAVAQTQAQTAKAPDYDPLSAF
ncbi:MAG: hypothetical protein J6O24_01295 [Succinivibrio sp.]|nr:hypothetical protein [Succinivibrio sp.]MDY6247194.1 hypothetical protein [Succinivibrio sp.]